MKSIRNKFMVIFSIIIIKKQKFCLDSLVKNEFQIEFFC